MRDLKDIMLREYDIVHVNKNSAANILPLVIAKKNPNWRIGNIYEEIANTYDTNYKQVEKRMREVRAESTLEKKTKRKTLTNSEVLRLLLIEERRM